MDDQERFYYENILAEEEILEQEKNNTKELKITVNIQSN
jgi:hypothetical protein